jgi:hypothetical protein
MRMTRPIAVALLLTLAPVVTTHPAFAQAAATDDATITMARARFKEGVEYYDKGEYELARASFLQAYALRKHPAVLLNLGWSCLKSGHALEAERYFKQFLSEGKEITDKQRADATDGAAQARGKLGRIDVLVPGGTDVTVDGDHLGTAPLADPVFVEGGAHTVKLRTADGTVDTQSITVLSGERTVARLKSATPAAAPPPPPEACAAAACCSREGGERKWARDFLDSQERLSDVPTRRGCHPRLWDRGALFGVQGSSPIEGRRHHGAPLDNPGRLVSPEHRARADNRQRVQCSLGRQ